MKQLTLNINEESETKIIASFLYNKIMITTGDNGNDLSNTEVITTLRGYSRMKDGKIHTDSKSKVLTFLLYLNEEWDNEKGLLRMLKNNFDLEDFIEEIPASFGSLVVFKVTENCWHGFHPVEGKRLSMQMNYVKKASVSSHKIRHGLSSFIKKLFS